MRWRLLSWAVNVAFVGLLVWCAVHNVTTAWSWLVFTPIFAIMVYSTYRADEEHVAALRRRARTNEEKKE